MYIYKLTEIETIDYKDVVKTCYLTHKDELTDDEFKRLCNEGLSMIEEKSLYCLKSWLIRNTGFRLLSVKSSFEFEGEYK